MKQSGATLTMTVAAMVYFYRCIHGIQDRQKVRSASDLDQRLADFKKDVDRDLSMLNINLEVSIDRKDQDVFIRFVEKKGGKDD